MVARLTPAVANHADRVENVSSSGSPLAKPSGRISNTRRSRYCAIERCHAVMPLPSTVTPSTTGMMNSYHERAISTALDATAFARKRRWEPLVANAAHYHRTLSYATAFVMLRVSAL